ncbi:MAG TPA: glycosyltransferase family 2 protein, partial [Candidatus Woesebacteria bacterium]|nr:glycosyltransferase family 2 protein [Candidatus Woesebacteria bacterium]
MNYLATIIIPTLLSNLDYLKNCLASLQKQKLNAIKTKASIEIIITCNTSQQEMLQGQKDLENIWQAQPANPQITWQWLCLGKNTGFTGAVNAGIKQAQGKYIVLLNDDTVVTENWLSELILTQQKTGAELVASKIYLSDQKTLDSQGFGFAWRGKAEALDQNLQCALSSEKDYWLNNPELLPKTRMIEPFGPDAAAALYTKELFDQIGLLAEDFFAYLEDVDLALRARQAGMNCVLAEKAIVYHYKHASSSKKQGFKAKQDLKNWCKIVNRGYNLAI